MLDTMMPKRLNIKLDFTIMEVIMRGWINYAMDTTSPSGSVTTLK